jgi:hypothetical protein
MGMSIELKVGDYEDIRNDLIERGVTDDKFIDKILLQFGFKSQDNYFLLNNEYWHEYNSYYNISEFIDRHYGVSNSFDAFLNNMRDANANWDVYEAANQLGVELPEHPDYD